VADGGEAQHSPTEANPGGEIGFQDRRWEPSLNSPAAFP
jgi:hypothetical protein